MKCHFAELLEKSTNDSIRSTNDHSNQPSKESGRSRSSIYEDVHLADGNSTLNRIIRATTREIMKIYRNNKETTGGPPTAPITPLSCTQSVNEPGAMEANVWKSGSENVVSACSNRRIMIRVTPFHSSPMRRSFSSSCVSTPLSSNFIEQEHSVGNSEDRFSIMNLNEISSTQGNWKIKTPSTKSSNRDSGSVTGSTAQYAQSSKREMIGPSEKPKCYETEGFPINITYSCVTPRYDRPKYKMTAADGENDNATISNKEQNYEPRTCSALGYDRPKYKAKATAGSDPDYDIPRSSSRSSMEQAPELPPKVKKTRYGFTAGGQMNLREPHKDSERNSSNEYEPMDRLLKPKTCP